MVWLFPKTPPSKNSDREKAIYNVKKSQYLQLCGIVQIFLIIKRGTNFTQDNTIVGLNTGNCKSSINLSKVIKGLFLPIFLDL